MRNIALLGATGSIGESTLNLLRQHPNWGRCQILSAHHNQVKLLALVKEFKPEYAILTGGKVSLDHIEECKKYDCQLLEGREALLELLDSQVLDTVLLAVSGAAGLEYGLKSLEGGARLAIANKEPLVIAGHLFKDMETRGKGCILPVDSEHSAIFQCLIGHEPKDVSKLILTSSGGPFHYREGSFEDVSVEEALQHPTWSMGSKITIDSATMMNKALEMVEAKWLFDVPLDQVSVTVHRQSIVHSMVEFVDGSMMAQMGVTDMQFPILYALSYPERWLSELPRLSFEERMNLTFEPVNPFLCQAIELIREYGDDPASMVLLNAANEVYVEAFLKRQVPFHKVYEHIRQVISEGQSGLSSLQSLSEVLELDAEGRKISSSIIKQV
jgi:1-deoxy-D-xylulose-5-phosphate reductoisomerase